MFPESVRQRLEKYIGLDPKVFHEHHLEYVWKKRMSEKGFSQDDVFAEILLNREEELWELGDEIYTPATWLFRHAAAFDYLESWVRERWIPQFSASGEILKILSYPCASGEEVHSLAIALHRAGLQANQFRVIGFDTRDYLLEKASRGVYSRASMRQSEFSGLESFFDTSAEDEMILLPEVRESVRFVHYNPLNAHVEFQAHAPYDIVFCRNLLVYLAPSYRRLLTEHLLAHLKPQGYLFAGNADNLPAIDGRFKLVGSKGSYAYQFDKNAAPQPKRMDLDGGLLNEFTPLDSIQYSRQETLKNARELVENGFAQEAEYICLEFLSKVGADAETFFLLGNIYDALNDSLRSEEAFRKCVYLENGHPEAFEALASLSEKRGHQTHARELRKRGTRAPF